MNRNLTTLCFILIFKACVMAAVILYAGIGLGPDEAQYWTWSQSIDWGYYSKPPGIAWQIWLGTQLFGNNEFGVRFASLLMGSLVPLSIYFLALKAGVKQVTAFWTALIMAFSPLGVLGTFFAITDVGMLLFWVLASIVIVDALNQNKTPNYLFFGTMIFLGALFKWPIYFLWLALLVMMPFCPILRSYKVILGLLISLLGFVPSLIWNINHEWGTFRHVFSTVKGGGKQGAGNFLDLLGMQIALISPILFILILISFVYLLKHRKSISWPLKFCGFSSIFLLFAAFGKSLFDKIQGNWVDFAYPMAFVLMGWVVMEKLFYEKWLKGGLLLSIVFCAFTVAFPKIQSMNWFPSQYELIPFKQNLGWYHLGEELSKVGYDSRDNFLFGDTYQMSSILSFYGPEQKRAYFLNFSGARKNQFSYWPTLADEQHGKTGFFVAAEHVPHLNKDPEGRIKRYQTHLEKYFKEVHFLGLKPILENKGKMIKGAFIYKCIDYNGTLPQNPELY